MFSSMTLAQGLPGLASLLSQTTGPTTGPAKPFWVDLFQGGSFILPIAVLFLLWIFLSSGSRRKEEKKRQELLNAIKRGTRVQTIGGIIGKVVDTETDKVLLKVDESTNTKIWFTRDAIRHVLEEEKAETK